MIRNLIVVAATSFTLILSGCGESASSEDQVSGEPIAPIAAAEGQKWSDTISQSDDGGYVMGNPEAPIKLVEFMSLTCGHCRDFGLQAFESIRDDYVASGRVSFEIRNYVRDPLDLTSALLTRCAGDSAFFALTEQSLNNMDNMFAQAQTIDEQKYRAILAGPPEKRFVDLAGASGLIAFFQQRGISADQAKACLSDSKGIDALGDYTQKANDDHDIRGTPTFLINGSKLDINTWAGVETRLQEMGAR